MKKNFILLALSALLFVAGSYLVDDSRLFWGIFIMLWANNLSQKGSQ